MRAISFTERLLQGNRPWPSKPRNRKGMQAYEGGELTGGDRMSSALHLLHRAGQCADELFANNVGGSDLTPRQFAVIKAVAASEEPSRRCSSRKRGSTGPLADIVRRLVAKGCCSASARRTRACTRLTEKGRRSSATRSRRPAPRTSASCRPCRWRSATPSSMRLPASSTHGPAQRRAEREEREERTETAPAVGPLCDLAERPGIIREEKRARSARAHQRRQTLAIGPQQLGSRHALR